VCIFAEVTVILGSEDGLLCMALPTTQMLDSADLESSSMIGACCVCSIILAVLMIGSLVVLAVHGEASDVPFIMYLVMVF
jgi:hypothetical protein